MMVKKLTIVLSCCAFGLFACTSTGTTGKNVFKTVSKLFGGQPDRKEFLDTTVKEALEYEYRLCLGEYEGHHEKMKECIDEAYAKVVEEKGIGERPDDGRVIIREVGDDEVINEGSQDDSEEDDNDNDNGDSQ